MFSFSDLRGPPALSYVPANRIEQEESNLKCRFTPLSVGNHTYIGKNCVVESAGIGCNVRIEDGCVLVRLGLDRHQTNSRFNVNGSACHHSSLNVSDWMRWFQQRFWFPSRL